MYWVHDDGGGTGILRAACRDEVSRESGKEERGNSWNDDRCLRRPSGEDKFIFQAGWSVWGGNQKKPRCQNQKSKHCWWFFSILGELFFKNGSPNIRLLIRLTIWTSWNVCGKEFGRRGLICGRMAPRCFITTTHLLTWPSLLAIFWWKPPPQSLNTPLLAELNSLGLFFISQSKIKIEGAPFSDTGGYQTGIVGVIGRQFWRSSFVSALKHAKAEWASVLGSRESTLKAVMFRVWIL